jgi:predicted AAA+ superfamily ATPase
MKTIFETCKPRDEVLSGNLRDEMFAARLKDVVDGTADPLYGDARHFFENTYPTEGLKTLVREVLGRISGNDPTASPFIRLETSFGGGKTHNLIALYHLAQGHASGLPAGVVEPSWVPKTPIPTAGIAGWELDPANKIDHGDVATRTLWGEVAWHLGKGGIGSTAAYEIVRQSDELMVAPGAQVLDKLVGDGPALIMLDEVARYLRAASAVPMPSGQGNLAQQTVAFLMTLIEFVASKPRVALVLTLADSSDAFTTETDTLKATLNTSKDSKSKGTKRNDGVELGEAKRISARQERVLTPAGEDEIACIVAHRLFKQIDKDAASDSAAEYQDYFRKVEGQGIDVPARALRSEYSDEMVTGYPFHPELLNTLNRKTSTIPNFQKTRGALRLLARVVRRLWQQKVADTWFIAPHHLDLAVDEIVNDLTSRLERPAFKSVVEADLASPKLGSKAHAQNIDQRWTDVGKPPYAQRTGTTILLHSLTQGIATGIESADLFLSVLQPGDDPQLVKKALAIMLAEEKGGAGTACWFLHFDGIRYRFKTEPALEKVIQDEMTVVGKVKTKAELDERIKKVWKKSTFNPRYFPGEPVDLEDDAKEPKLAILHYDAASTTGTGETPPELIARLFDHAGSTDGYRRFKNNVVFLCVDGDQVERMVEVVQRYLAVQRVVSDSDRMAEFSDEQKSQLKKMHEAAELDVRVAVTKGYRHLYYPSADAPKSGGGLQRETLPAQDQGKVDKDQTTVVLGVLRQLQKTLTAEDPEMPAAYVKAKAWPHGQVSVTTADLQREFAKRIGLKILLDVNQLKKTVRKGCEQGVWVYFDTTEQIGYGKPSPAPMVQFSEDAILYTLEEALRLGLKIKGEDKEPKLCPLCGEDPCVCGDVCPRCGQRPCVCHGDGWTCPICGNNPCTCRLLLRFSLDGPPAKVFQAIADRFHDAKATHIAKLTIRTEGAGSEAAKDARALGLAIPQLGKGTYHVDQQLTAEFGAGADAERFNLSFSGSWNRYKRVKQLTDAFGQEATKVTCKTTLRAMFDEGLDVSGEQFGQMRDIFTSLDLGKIIVDVEEKAAAGEA